MVDSKMKVYSFETICNNCNSTNSTRNLPICCVHSLFCAHSLYHNLYKSRYNA